MLQCPGYFRLNSRGYYRTNEPLMSYITPERKIKRIFRHLTCPATLPIGVAVENHLSNLMPESYSSSVVEGGVLLGALRRLQETQHDFKFTVKEDSDFGLLLESVNGITGNEYEHTYWEILSESSGEYSRLAVGIGCYMPKENEHIILRLSTWSHQ